MQLKYTKNSNLSQHSTQDTALKTFFYHTIACHKCRDHRKTFTTVKSKSGDSFDALVLTMETLVNANTFHGTCHIKIMALRRTSKNTSEWSFEMFTSMIPLSIYQPLSLSLSQKNPSRHGGPEWRRGCVSCHRHSSCRKSDKQRCEHFHSSVKGRGGYDSCYTIRMHFTEISMEL